MQMYCNCGATLNGICPRFHGIVFLCIMFLLNWSHFATKIAPAKFMMLTQLNSMGIRTLVHFCTQLHHV